ncbi:N-acetylglucosaminyl-phosphatidylinositol de-N-acetylase [Zalaria obscura]|uniref:N-acetylglucosaminyl-phosphatidylinositol de-N-acetylase n=1 Tax=Zalaria obscura TaxID=2024903 RepID=A0ACC3SNK2_9PEZI
MWSVQLRFHWSAVTITPLKRERLDDSLLIQSTCWRLAKMHWATWATLPIFIIVLWLYTAQLAASLPQLRGKRICLLIAHPDDEAMFFAPTVLSLTRPDLGNHVKILCLSSGNADGLGETRKKELVKSGLLLGLRSEDDVLVLDDPNFPDSMTVTWDAKRLTSLLTSTFAPKMSKISSKQPPEASIDVLITFDQHGISSHPNHISLYHGSVNFLRTLMQRHSGWECPIKLYTLTTTNIFRKYASILEAPISVASAVFARKESGNFPTPMLFVSGVGGYRKAQNAMTQAHVSQMRWFRWGWIGISRYMIVNDLRKERGL